MSRIFKRGDVKNDILKTSLTVLGSLLLTAGVVAAATTINTSISTGGTLTVTGASTIGGAVTGYSSGTFGATGTTTLSAAGDVSFVTASSTGLVKLNSLQLTGGQSIDAVQSSGALTIGGTNAGTITIGRTGQLVSLAGNATTSGTFEVTGVSMFSTASSTGKFSLGSVDLTSALDTVTSGNALTIGGTRAGTITIGRTGQVVSLPGHASTTGNASVTGNFWQNGTATTTSAGNFSTKGTLTVAGLSALNGAASTTNLSASGAVWHNGYATTTSTGAISTETTLTVLGDSSLATASSTGLVKANSLNVSGSGTDIAGLVFGFCNLPASKTITATSTQGVICSGATKLTTAHRVFVSATSSLSSRFVIKSASSTEIDGQIGLMIENDGGIGGLSATLDQTSISFIGIK